MKRLVFGNGIHGMKRAFIAALLCGASCLASYAEEQNILTLVFGDGTRLSYVLADRPKVTFDDTRLYVNAAEVADDYELASVRKFLFGKGEPTSIAAVDNGESRLTYVDGENVELSGLKSGARVVLCDASGSCLYVVSSDAEGCASLSLADRSAGVYVVSVEGGRSFKILKK